MKTLYLDCFSGISGDMFAAALLDLGADAGALHAAVAGLGIPGCSVEIRKKQQSGILGTDIQVVEPHAEHHEGHPHRTWADIAALLDAASLQEPVRETAKKIFTIIAEAEGRVHGMPAEEVRFHEVGAVDSIVDIVAAAVLVHSLGQVRVVCSPLTDGSGTITCAHGVLPVPVPATAEILRAHHVPFACCDAGTELVTPTGAAIAAGLAERFGTMPPMTIARIGYGCGKRETGRPNLLRAVLGEETAGEAGDRVAVLETTIDDSTGEALGYALEQLFEAGVRDAYFTPVFMKKGRPAYALTVLCAEEKAEFFARLLFENTATIGLRKRICDRVVMQRSVTQVETAYGKIDCKRCEYDGIVKLKPEYESLREAAKRHGVPLAQVTAAVVKEI